MEMKDNRVIAVDQLTVWAGLLDPDVLKLCIPGYTAFAGSPADGFEATVGGKLAQLGARLIDGFARKMADGFFARFQEAVEGPAGDGNTRLETG